MISRKIMVVLSLTMAFFMYGCREYSLYRFETTSVRILSGELFVSVEGMYSDNRVENGKKKASLGYPYTLLFKFALPYGFGFSEMRVTSIKLVGMENGEAIELPDGFTSEIKDPRKRTNPSATARIAMISFGGLDENNFKYQSYNLMAKLVVVNDEGEEREESFSVLLKKEFKKEKRSDWLDKHMSI